MFYTKLNLLFLSFFLFACSKNFSGSEPHYFSESHEASSHHQKSELDDFLKFDYMNLYNSFKSNGDVLFNLTYKNKNGEHKLSGVRFKPSDYKVVNNALISQILANESRSADAIKLFERFSEDLDTLFGASLIDFNIHNESRMEFLSLVNVMGTQNVSNVSLEFELTLDSELSLLLDSISSLNLGLYHFDGQEAFDRISTFDPVHSVYNGRFVSFSHIMKSLKVRFHFSPDELYSYQGINFGPNSQFFLKIDNMIYKHDEAGVKILRQQIDKLQSNQSLLYIHNSEASHLYVSSGLGSDLARILKYLDPRSDVKTDSHDYLKVKSFYGKSSGFRSGRDAIHVNSWNHLKSNKYNLDIIAYADSKTVTKGLYDLNARVPLSYGEVFSGYFDRGDQVLFIIDAFAHKYQRSRKHRNLRYQLQHDRNITDRERRHILFNNILGGQICDVSENFYSIKVEKNNDAIKEFFQNAFSVSINGRDLEISEFFVNITKRGVVFELNRLEEGGFLKLEALDWGGAYKRGDLNDFNVISCSDPASKGHLHRFADYPQGFFPNFEYQHSSWPSLMPEGSVRVYQSH